MDQERFANAVLKEKIEKGIGTLSEKTLHRIIKNYYDITGENQEIKIGKFFADILFKKEIIEVQTKQFRKLNEKLDYYLWEYNVRVCYPTFNRKNIIWLDNDKNIVSKRLSPSKGSIHRIFPELYQIKKFLTNPNFRLTIILLDIDEYRLLNGYSKDKKRGSWCYDRIPSKIADEIEFNCIEDFNKFYIDSLKDNFTAKDYAKEAHISLKSSRIGMNVLSTLGIIKKVGKNVNEYIYTWTSKTPNI